jgi:DNA-directed RNA polymerase specialized sigma24 family protein
MLRWRTLGLHPARRWLDTTAGRGLLDTLEMAMRSARKLGLATEEAWDTTVDAIVRAGQRKATVTPISLHRELVLQRRATKARSVLLALDEAQERHVSDERTEFDDVLHADVARELSKLSPQQRLVIEFVVIEGVSIQEAAQHLSVSPQTAELEVRKGLETLRAALHDYSSGWNCHRRSLWWPMFALETVQKPTVPGRNRLDEARKSNVVLEPEFSLVAVLKALPRWALVAFAARCAREAVDKLIRNDDIEPSHRESATRAIRLTEDAAAQANDTSLDLKDYSLSSAGYVSRIDYQPSYQYGFSDHIRQAHRAGELSGDDLVKQAFSAAANAAKSAHYATWAKGALDWDTYGSNAANIAMAREREHDATCLRHVKIAAVSALKSGVPDSVLSSHCELLFAATRREHWDAYTPVPASFFSPDSDIERQVIFAINDMCVEICRLIARDARGLRQVDWRMCEQLVATALAGIGFKVELTPCSGDGGKDVVATCILQGRTRRYYLEVKHWRCGTRVGANDISDFVEVNVRDGTDGGLFLSSSGYTRSVYSQVSEITKARVRLGDDTKIVSLCQRFVQSQGRAVWQASSVLPDVLFEHTNSPGRPSPDKTAVESLRSSRRSLT